MKTYSIGIDPDLHTLPIALVSAENGKAELEGIWTIKSKGTQKEEAVEDMLGRLNDKLYTGSLFSGIFAGAKPLVTVESQNVSYTGKTNAANPQDLIYLAQVAGGCLGLFWRGRLVQPSVWKKTMPKRIVQSRCFRALGLTYSVKGGATSKGQYCVPYRYKEFDRTGNLFPGDFKDAGDSIALAFWRLKQEGLCT